MKINTDLCISCNECFKYCPAGAIREIQGSVCISEALCFECGVCERFEICPVNAFIESDDIAQYPRVVRTFFSNPNTTHKLTLVPGRGTEESKTNDVTGRIKKGEIGICIEFGRPGLGTSFKDISLMTSKLYSLGAEFEPNNPLVSLIDHETGLFPEILQQERVLSAILEIKVGDLSDLETYIPAIIEISEEVDTVFSLSFISRYQEDGELPILDKLTNLGIAYAPNAKINLGMGKPLCEI